MARRALRGSIFQITPNVPGGVSLKTTKTKAGLNLECKDEKRNLIDPWYGK